MKLSSISDVHITPNNPERFNLFKKFCESKEVQESNIVVLLGDIFDIMIGNKKGYIRKYNEFFQLIGQLLKQDKKLYIVEGNHDFHTKELFYDYISKNFPEYINLLIHVKNETSILLNGKKIYVGHGDILDHKNDAFKRWKVIYSSKSFKFFVEKILPFSLVEYLGHRASRNSKKRSKSSFNYKEAQDKYRDGFHELVSKEEYDIVLTGHTHIKEDYTFKNTKLLNNGFFPSTKEFIYIDEQTSSLVKLEES